MHETTRYWHVRKELRSGDVGLVRTGNLIAQTGRSEESHAFLLAWRHADQSTLLVAESREGRGGQLLTLSSQVREYPGQIDIYRPTCVRLLAERAATIAVNWSGKRYSYPNILKIWLAHHPLLRKAAEEYCLLRGWQNPFVLDEVHPSPWDEPKICSQLVTWAFREAKHELGNRLKPSDAWWDLVPGLNDRFVEPADIARSGSKQLIAKGLVL
jgi:hypothetical protein